MKTKIICIVLTLLLAPLARAAFTIDTTTSGSASSVPFGTRGEHPGNLQDDDADGLIDEADPLRRYHTVGQTFLVPTGNPTLTAFSFVLFDNYPAGQQGVGVSDAPIEFYAYVMDWDFGNQRPVGGILYQSSLQTSFNDGANHTFSFSPLALGLTAGNDYVAFLTQNSFERNPGNNIGSTVVTRNLTTYTDGQLVTKTDGTLSFAGLTSESWTPTASSDAAFTATFEAVPEPSTYMLLGLGGYLLLRRGKM